MMRSNVLRRKLETRKPEIGKPAGICLDPKIKSIVELILQAVYPPRCAGCDEILPIGEKGFCPDCMRRIHVVAGPVCVKCGKQVTANRVSLADMLTWEDEPKAGRRFPSGSPEGDTEAGRRPPSESPEGDTTTCLCNDCRSTPHPYDSGRAVFVYEGAMKQSIYRFKYANRRRYADAYRDVTLQHPEVSQWLRQINGGGFQTEDFSPVSQGIGKGDSLQAQPLDLILPIPMYRGKQRIRGYNQAGEFGRALGHGMGVLCDEHVVERVVDTPALKTMTPQQRHQALIQAFQYKKSGVKLTRVLLVDDIYTTGTTVDAVARILRDMGAREIYVLCIAIGRGAYRRS
ncbi:MAG: double zinc ribbon domain-containing protein [Lachnospiraceae bacterium]|nr:double zinc ribbon domain-containing protein [Lachnospiraceae bacterium]